MLVSRRMSSLNEFVISTRTLNAVKGSGEICSLNKLHSERGSLASALKSSALNFVDRAIGNFSRWVSRAKNLTWRSSCLGLAGIMSVHIALGQQTAQAPAPASRSGHAVVQFHEPDPIDFNDHTGFVQIFDGRTLDSGMVIPRRGAGREAARLWANPLKKSHRATATSPITGWWRRISTSNSRSRSSMAAAAASSTAARWEFLAARASRAEEFNLDWMMTGPQADFWFPVSPRNFFYTGQFYSENTSLGILAWRGQVV